MTPTTTLNLITNLQKQNQDQLGFLTHETLSQYVDREQVDVAFENDDPCGYLLWYDGRNGHRPIARPDTLHIHQACIDYDVRFLDHGRDLVNNLIVRAQHHGFRNLTCWVGSNIPAVGFWNALGFIQDGSRTGRGRRHPTHLHFTYPIPAVTRDFTTPFQHDPTTP